MHAGGDRGPPAAASSGWKEGTTPVENDARVVRHDWRVCAAPAGRQRGFRRNELCARLGVGTDVGALRNRSI